MSDVAEPSRKKQRKEPVASQQNVGNGVATTNGYQNPLCTNPFCVKEVTDKEFVHPDTWAKKKKGTIL